MSLQLTNTYRLLTVLAAATLVSACASSGSRDTGSIAEDDMTVAENETVAPLYTSTGAGMLSVDPLEFDPANAPRACVNDLRVYRTHLQMPGVSHLDLNKPINAYVQDAGGTEAAIDEANDTVTHLNQQLDLELARRNPFNTETRRTTDDAIASIEDRIMLNQALAEALECHR